MGGTSTLNEEQRARAKELYLSGLSMDKVGEELGFSHGCVLRVLKRQGIKRRPKAVTSIKNVDIFKTIDTPEKAYWLGFMATDGNVFGTRVQINLCRRDEGHLLKFRDFLGGSTSIKHRTKKDKQTGKTYLLATYSFRCKELVQDLSNHGILPKKSMTILPWKGPEHLMSHYWRGCVDGDGWVGQSKSVDRLSFCGNLMMVTAFSEWVKGFTDTVSSVRPHKNIFTFEIARKKAEVVTRVLYKDAEVFLQRKFLHAKRIMAFREAYTTNKDVRRINRNLKQRTLQDHHGPCGGSAFGPPQTP